MATTEQEMSNQLSSTENRNLIHLDYIQKAINKYDMQSLVFRSLAIVTVMSMVVTYGFASSTSAVALPMLVALAVLFMLWATDAHYHQNRRLYVRLYDKARVEDTPEMDMSVFSSEETFMKSMWAAPLSWVYLGSISSLALLSILTL